MASTGCRSGPGRNAVTRHVRDLARPRARLFDMRVIFAFGVAALVILGHVGLWTSERVPTELKADLTRINATAWAIVLLPAVAVTLWLRAQRRNGHERRREDTTTE